MVRRPPKYRQHTARDLGFIEYDGKRHYLPGLYNSAESRAAYYEHLDEYCARHQIQLTHASNPDIITIEEIAAGFLQHCASYYGRSDPLGS